MATKAKFQAFVNATYFTLDGVIKNKDFENWYELGGKQTLPADHKFETHHVVLASKDFEGKGVWATFDTAKAYFDTGVLAIEAQAAADKLGLDNIRTSKLVFIEAGIHRV
jgi:hypothetical protein